MIVGEAWVALRPLLTGFDEETQAKIDAAFAAQTATPTLDTTADQGAYDKLGTSADDAAAKVEGAGVKIDDSNKSIADQLKLTESVGADSLAGLAAASETSAERITAASDAIRGASVKTAETQKVAAGEAAAAQKSAASDAEASGGIFASLGSKIVGGTALGIAAIGGIAADTAVKFQTAVAQLQGVAGITQAQANAIGKALLSTAGTTTFGASQMVAALAPVSAQLATLQGHALTASQDLLFMKSAADLAEASNSDLGATTSALATVMRAFSIQVKGTAAASNVLFNTSSALGVPVTSLTTSLARLHSTLGDLSPSLAGTSTLIIDAANSAGLQGTRGINALGSAFQHFLGEVGNAGTATAKSLQTAQDSVTKAGLSIKSAQNSATESMSSVIAAQQRLTAATTEYNDAADPTIAQQEAIKSAELAVTAAQQRHSVALQNVAAAQTKAGQAATSLKNIQDGSAVGNSKVNATLKQLGISTIDVGGKFEGMRKLIAQLQPALAKLTPAARDLADQNLFGATSAQKVGQIIEAGVPAYDKAAAAVTRSGAASKAAQDKLNTFSGTWKSLKASVEDALIPLGQVVLKALTELLKPLTPVIAILGKELSAAFTALGPVFNTLGPVIGNLVKILGVGLVDAIKLLAPVFDTVIKAVGLLLPPLIQLLVPIGGLVDSIVKDLAPALADLLPPIEAIVDDLVKALGPAFAEIVKGLEPLLSAIAFLNETLIQALMPAFKALMPPIDQIITILGQLVSQLGQTLAPVIRALAPVIGTLVSALSSILGPALTVVAGLFKVLAPIIEQIVKALAGPLQSILAVIAPVIGSLGKAIGQVLSALTPLLAPLGQLLKALTPLLAPLLTLVVDLISPLLKLLTPLSGVIADVAKVLGGALAGAVKIITAILQPFIKLITGLVGGIQSIAKWADSTKDPLYKLGASLAGTNDVFVKHQDLVSKAIPNLGALANQLHITGAELSDFAKKGNLVTFTNLISTGQTAQADKFVAEFNARWKKAAGLATNAGQEVTAGVVAGIINSNPNLLAAAGKMTAATIDKISADFGVASPAKTMVPIGEAIPEGIAVGFTSRFSVMVEAIRQFVAKITAEFARLNPTLNIGLQAHAEGSSTAVVRTQTRELYERLTATLAQLVAETPGLVQSMTRLQASVPSLALRLNESIATLRNSARVEQDLIPAIEVLTLAIRDDVTITREKLALMARSFAEHRVEAAPIAPAVTLSLLQRQVDSLLRQTQVLEQVNFTDDRMLTLALSGSELQIRGLELSTTQKDSLSRLVILETAEVQQGVEKIRLITEIEASTSALAASANQALADCTAHFSQGHELAEREFSLHQQELTQLRAMALLMRQQLEEMQKTQKLTLMPGAGLPRSASDGASRAAGRTVGAKLAR